MQESPKLEPSLSAQWVRDTGDIHTVAAPIPESMYSGQVRYVKMGLPSLRDMPKPPNTTSHTERLNENPKIPYRHTIPYRMEDLHSLQGVNQRLSEQSPLPKVLARLVSIASSTTRRTEGERNLPVDNPPLRAIAFTIDRSRGPRDTRVRQIPAMKMEGGDYLACSLPDGSLAVFQGDALKGTFTHDQLHEGGVFIEREFYLTRYDAATGVIEVGRAGVQYVESEDDTPETTEKSTQLPWTQSLRNRVRGSTNEPDDNRQNNKQLEKDRKPPERDTGANKNVYRDTILAVLPPDSPLRERVVDALNDIESQDSKSKRRISIARWVVRIPFLLPFFFLLAGDSGPITNPPSPDAPPTPGQPVMPVEGASTPIVIPHESFRPGPDTASPIPQPEGPRSTPRPRENLVVENGIYVDNIAEDRLRQDGFDTELRADLVDKGVLQGDESVEDKRKFELVWQRLIALTRILYMVVNEQTLQNPHELHAGEIVYQPYFVELQKLYNYFKDMNFDPPHGFNDTNRAPRGRGDDNGMYVDLRYIVRALLRGDRVIPAGEIPTPDGTRKLVVIQARAPSDSSSH